VWLTTSTLASRHECVRGSGCINPYFLYLGTSWRRAVSFTPPTALPRRTSASYPFDKRLAGPKEPVWKTWRRENPWPYRDLKCNHSVHQSVASRYNDSPIPGPLHFIIYNLHSCNVLAQDISLPWKLEIAQFLSFHFTVSLLFIYMELCILWILVPI
jgi:hypothetical protein